MLINIHPENPPSNQISKVVECLKSGGVIVYPTDTVYGMGCDVKNHDAIMRLCKIKGLKDLEKSRLSFVCYDLSHLSEYCKPIDNKTFRILKEYLPGPFTFILNAGSNAPKLLKTSKKTVGIRIPNNNIIRLIAKSLGNPIISTSVHDDDKLLEYSTDPELIYEKYKNRVDMVVNGGYGGNEASTVVDCTTDEYKILRLGKGVFEKL